MKSLQRLLAIATGSIPDKTLPTFKLAPADLAHVRNQAQRIAALYGLPVDEEVIQHLSESFARTAWLGNSTPMKVADIAYEGTARLEPRILPLVEKMGKDLASMNETLLREYIFQSASSRNEDEARVAIVEERMKIVEAAIERVVCKDKQLVRLQRLKYPLYAQAREDFTNYLRANIWCEGPERALELCAEQTARYASMHWSLKDRMEARRKIRNAQTHPEAANVPSPRRRRAMEQPLPQDSGAATPSNEQKISEYLTALYRKAENDLGALSEALPLRAETLQALKRQTSSREEEDGLQTEIEKEMLAKLVSAKDVREALIAKLAPSYPGYRDPRAEELATLASLNPDSAAVPYKGSETYPSMSTATGDSDIAEYYLSPSDTVRDLARGIESLRVQARPMERDLDAMAREEDGLMAHLRLLDKKIARSEALCNRLGVLMTDLTIEQAQLECGILPVSGNGRGHAASSRQHQPLGRFKIG